MGQSPLLSVVTVCFNDLEGLLKTEKSIIDFNNCKGSVEWIVIDGDSKDKTKDFLSSTSTIKKYISEKDDGIYDAMNKGTALAAGRYVVYMNSGDTFKNLEIVLSEISKDNCDLLFFDALFNYGKFSRIRAARDFSYIRHGIPANHQAIVFRRSALGHCPYDVKYKICGDYKLLADLYQKGLTYRVVNKVAAEFLVGGASTTRGIKLLSEAYLIQRSTLEISRSRALISVLRRSIAILATLVLYRINYAGFRTSKPVSI